MKIKPIETEYKGYKFRSRLEARWAVFFDVIKVEWLYEVEGYDLGGIWYLPDFYFPELECYGEIKPNHIMTDSNGKPIDRDKEILRKCALLADGTNKPVYLFTGSTVGDVWFNGKLDDELADDIGDYGKDCFPYLGILPGKIVRQYCQWGMCECGKSKILPSDDVTNDHGISIDQWENEFRCNFCGKFNQFNIGLDRACLIARQYKFHR